MTAPSLFRLFDLPLDLQVEILGSDASFCFALIRVAPQAKALYLSYPQRIFSLLLKSWPLQLRYLIRTIVALRQHLISVRICSNSIQRFYEAYVEPKTGYQPERIHFLDTSCSIERLDMLQSVALEIEIFGTLFKRCLRELNATSKSFSSKYQKTPPRDVAFSEEELYRMQRAFLRFGLYTILCQEEKCFLVDGASPINTHDFFLSRLQPWELGEFFTIGTYITNFITQSSLSNRHDPLRNTLNNYCPHSLILGMDPKALQNSLCTMSSRLDAAVHTSRITNVIVLRDGISSSPRIWTDIPATANLMSAGTAEVGRILQIPYVLPNSAIKRSWLLIAGLHIWDTRRLKDTSWRDSPLLNKSSELKSSQVKALMDSMLAEFFEFWENEKCGMTGRMRDIHAEISL
ncbi:hypothetical protein CC78DRAFT_618738 [Lojkania enalia]|uniref:Uncharacterized protein n=1 Tax=Lojkania enalia TaxID=147567 RepID=A0A9P4MY91_9PLEO|nr:hypothetical protein CC78DRAFT_618738 [Didymosphaeria enalia]